MAKKYRARPIDRLGRLVVILLWIDLAASAFDGVLALVDWSLLHGVAPSTPLGPYGAFPVLPEIADLTAMLRLVAVASWLITAVATLKWIYRANMNAQTWSGGMRVSPPWAIGWFFVPFANLWKPYEGVADTWRVSHGVSLSARSPAGLRIWWALWLASGILGNAAGRLAMRAETVGAMSLASVLEALSAAISILATVLFVTLVRQITGAQTLRIAATRAAEDASSAA